MPVKGINSNVQISSRLECPSEGGLKGKPVKVRYNSHYCVRLNDA